MSLLQDKLNFAAAKQAHFDNADYRETGSTSKAKAFMTACTRLIGLLPKTQSHGERGGESVTFDIRELREQIADAKQFVSTKATSAGGFSQLRTVGDYCR